MEVRDYRPSDAASLSRLIIATSFGSDAGDGRMTARTLQETLEERCADVTVVGVDEGRIVGALAFFRGSGRRVSRRGELYADMYLIDPQYRNSKLGGELFALGYQRILSLGIRTLRTEASPANPAFGIYTRVGFRCKPTALPDQRGYLELTSHLPGIIRDIGEADPRYQEDPPGFHGLRARRAAGASSGVAKKGTRWEVEYEIRTPRDELSVVVDFDTNETLAVRSSTLDQIRRASGFPSARGEEEAWRGGFGDDQWVVSVGEYGTLTVEDAEGNPALLERWPVVRGSEPPGWRSASPSLVEKHGRGLIVTGIVDDQTGLGVGVDLRHDGIQRSLTLHDDGIEIRTTSAHDIITSPWVRMRKSVWGVRSGRDWFTAPTRQGIWPPSATDFEPAVRECFGDERDATINAVAASARGGTLMAEWSGAEARMEGLHLAQLIVRAGETGTWRLRTVSDFAVHDDGVIGWAPPARTADASASDATRPHEPVAWSSPNVEGVRTAHTGDHVLAVNSNGALVSWRFDGRDVLNSSWPRSRTLGPLVDWAAGAWATGLPDRHDPECGVAWTGPGASSPPAGDTSVRWFSCPADQSFVRAEVSVDDEQTREAALFITPTHRGGRELLVGVDGGVWAVSDRSRRWEGSFDFVAVPFTDDQWLIIDPRVEESPDDREVFVRAGDGPLLVTCLGQTPSPLVVELRVCGSREVEAFSRRRS